MRMTYCENCGALKRLDTAHADEDLTGYVFICKRRQRAPIRNPEAYFSARTLCVDCCQALLEALRNRLAERVGEDVARKMRKKYPPKSWLRRLLRL